MRKSILLFMFVIITSVSLISYSAGADLKQKCSEQYRTCLDDCKKSAARGKKYTWKDPFPE